MRGGRRLRRQLTYPSPGNWIPTAGHVGVDGLSLLCQKHHLENVTDLIIPHLMLSCPAANLRNACSASNGVRLEYLAQIIFSIHFSVIIHQDGVGKGMVNPGADSVNQTYKYARKWLSPRAPGACRRTLKSRHGSFFANPNFPFARDVLCAASMCHCPASWTPAPTGPAT